MNPEIVIVHDSAASLPEDIRRSENPGLAEVHFTICANDQAKWVDKPFSSDQERAGFVKDLQTARMQTSRPNIEAYRSVFARIIESGVTEIVVLPTSEQLSKSIDSANMAAKMFKNQAEIAIVDSRTVSVGQGLLVTQAEMEVRDGRFTKAADLAGRVEKLSKQLHLAQALSNLEQLRKGGRIGRCSKMLGGIMDIKPIIGVNAKGQIEPLSDDQTGWQRARGFIVDYISKEVGQDTVRLAFVQFESDQLDNLRHDAAGRFNLAKDGNGDEYDPLICEQSMVVSVHSGPGVIGLGALVL